MKLDEPRTLETVPSVAEGAGIVLGRIARHGLWSLLAYGSAAGSAFAVSVVVARVLGPEAFGAYSYYLWLLRLVPYLLAFGIPVAITKVVAERLGRDEAARARGIFRLGVGMHLLAAPPAAAAGFWLVWRSRGSVFLAAVMALGIVTLLFALDFEALLTALRRFSTLGLLAAGVGVGQVAFVAVGVALDSGWEGYLSLQVVGSGLGLACMWWLCRSWSRAGERISAPDRRSFFRFAAVIATVLAVEALVWGRPELWFLARYRSDTELGLYAAALRLVGFTGVLPLVGARAILPEFSFLLGGGRHAEVRDVYPRVCKLMALVGAPLSLGGAAIAGPVVRLIYGDAFAGAATAAAILLVGSFMSAAVPASAAVLTGPRPRFITEVVVVAAAINVALDFALIPRFGIVGAAAINVGVQLGAGAVGIGYVTFRLGLPYPVAAVGRVIVLATPMALIAGAVSRMVGGWTGIAAGIVSGGLAYGALVAATGTLKRDDLRVLRGPAPPTLDADR